MRWWYPFGRDLDTDADYRPFDRMFCRWLGLLDSEAEVLQNVVNEMAIMVWRQETVEGREETSYIEVLAFAGDLFAAAIPLHDLIDRHLREHRAVKQYSSADAEGELQALQHMRQCLDQMIKERIAARDERRRAAGKPLQSDT
jgi:hypothetical protein